MARILERAASETQFLTGEPWASAAPDDESSIATVGTEPKARTYLAGRGGEKKARVQLAQDVQGNQAAWLEDTLRKFVQLLELPPNWDGHGARVVEPAILNRALSFLLEIVPPTAPAPYVVPSPQGGVQVEWHEPAGDVEIEFKGDGTVSFFMETDDRAVEESAPTERILEVARQSLELLFSTR